MCRQHPCTALCSCCTGANEPCTHAGMVPTHLQTSLGQQPLCATLHKHLRRHTPPSSPDLQVGFVARELRAHLIRHQARPERGAVHQLATGVQGQRGKGGRRPCKDLKVAGLPRRTAGKGRQGSRIRQQGREARPAENSSLALLPASHWLGQPACRHNSAACPCTQLKEANTRIVSQYFGSAGQGRAGREKARVLNCLCVLLTATRLSLHSMLRLFNLWASTAGTAAPCTHPGCCHAPHNQANPSLRVAGPEDTCAAAANCHMRRCNDRVRPRRLHACLASSCRSEFAQGHIFNCSPVYKTSSKSTGTGSAVMTLTAASEASRPAPRWQAASRSCRGKGWHS